MMSARIGRAISAWRALHRETGNESASEAVPTLGQTHVLRLRLLSVVASEGEVCSCNLEDPLGKSQPTISHHTRVLADAGLIIGERRGRWTWWRAVPEEIRRLQGPLAVGGEHSVTVEA
jgi:ArsR family transcriptional regulator